MAPRLILNADDFGLTPGINRAIAELHQANALTSATLMATGPAFEDAVRIARALPTLGVGCHLVFTNGLPVSPPDTIPTLLGPDGRSFRPSLISFIRALLSGAIREDDLEREALAQIDKLQRAGIPITHLDTHKHTHLFPAVARPLLRVAERTSIRAIRNPFEPPWCLALGHGNRVRRLQMKILDRLRPRFEQHPQIRNARVMTTNGTIGISTTGRLDSTTLREILRALSDALSAALPDALPADSASTFELCCHPGYNDLEAVTTHLRAHRDVERQALLSEVPKLRLHPNAPELIHYGDLAPSNSDTRPIEPARTL